MPSFEERHDRLHNAVLETTLHAIGIGNTNKRTFADYQGSVSSINSSMPLAHTRSAKIIVIPLFVRQYPLFLPVVLQPTELLLVKNHLEYISIQASSSSSNHKNPNPLPFNLYPSFDGPHPSQISTNCARCAHLQYCTGKPFCYRSHSSASNTDQHIINQIS